MEFLHLWMKVDDIIRASSRSPGPAARHVLGADQQVRGRAGLCRLSGARPDAGQPQLV